MVQLTNLANTADLVAKMRPALFVLLLILAAVILSTIVFTVIYARSNKGSKLLLGILYGVTIVILACTLLCFYKYKATSAALRLQAITTGPATTVQQTTEASTVAETTIQTEPPEPTFDPVYTDNSNPNNWGIKWDIYENDSAVSSYNRPEPITFGKGSVYTALEGITTFRGDNYRSGATYGTANVVNKTLATAWSSKIGAFNTWTGSGWTGQPLVVRWDNATKAIMNLYPEKKAKEGLVEVIYATLDGYVYFYDLEDGSYTRDRIWVGMNFKGAGSLDPRGYPLMYVGGGDKVDGKAPKIFVISLVDGKILYERSGSDSIAHRRWFAFDSAPLVDAETDTLIWPGESGVLYTFKLNTQYDVSTGSLSVSPEVMAKTRYKLNNGRKPGCESSTLIVGSYLYFADNGGMFFCVDLNTMQPVWVQDTHDDVNATPVFQWEADGKGYIYTGTSMEFAKGTCYIHKLDAATGEIIWEKKYENVAYNADVSGGILSSPVLGEKGTDMEGLIVYSISRTPTAGSGTLVALNTETGDVVWEKSIGNYAWSSPTAINTAEGKTYLILFDSVGKGALIEGVTGEVLNTISLGSNVEASPVVFEDTIVVGTRGQKVFGIKIQ